MTKYKDGDLVTFRVGPVAADTLNSGRHCRVYEIDIIDHKLAQIDWSQVKSGDVFILKGDPSSKYKYVGPSPGNPEKVAAFVIATNNSLVWGKLEDMEPVK